MKNRMLNKVFIAGGYGMIGSAIAHQLRERFPEVEIVIAGRRPEKGIALAAALGNASTASLDLSGKTIPPKAAEAQLIIAAVPDGNNLLGEFAIRHDIAFINITSASGDDVLPLLHLARRYQTSQPVVPLGYYEAGMALPLVSLLAADFKTVDSVTLSALHDPADPLGELSASELGNEIPPALIRTPGGWRRTSQPREITLHDGARVTGTPFTILDTAAVAAMTGAAAVRLDVAAEVSLGMQQRGAPSIDLYVDMAGTDKTGQKIEKRLIASDPHGQAHLTAFGVLTVIGAMLKSEKGGLVLVEELLDMEKALRAMENAGISVFPA